MKREMHPMKQQIRARRRRKHTAREHLASYQKGNKRKMNKYKTMLVLVRARVRSACVREREVMLVKTNFYWPSALFLVLIFTIKGG